MAAVPPNHSMWQSSTSHRWTFILKCRWTLWNNLQAWAVWKCRSLKASNDTGTNYTMKPNSSLPTSLCCTPTQAWAHISNEYWATAVKQTSAAHPDAAEWTISFKTFWCHRRLLWLFQTLLNYSRISDFWAVPFECLRKMPFFAQMEYTCLSCGPSASSWFRNANHRKLTVK